MKHPVEGKARTRKPLDIVRSLERENREPERWAASLDPDPIHGMFGLTYATYLTIPRTALQSMPQAWQAKLVALMEELSDTLNWVPEGGTYNVTLRDSKGRMMFDPLRDYQRGRRKLPVKPSEPRGDRGGEG